MSERPPISPRSPRAALEPEQVPPPPKRSERARNPFVVIGNAIITILIILMIGAGTTYYYGRQLLETPGPLLEDKVVNIPARAGKRDEAKSIVAELEQRRTNYYVSPVALATVYIGLGNNERALDWSEVAYEERRGWLAYFTVNPLLDPLREEPRFKALVARLRR